MIKWISNQGGQCVRTSRAILGSHLAEIHVMRIEEAGGGRPCGMTTGTTRYRIRHVITATTTIIETGEHMATSTEITATRYQTEMGTEGSQLLRTTLR